MQVIRILKDDDCPLCNHPELVLVCEKETMKPLRFECGKRECMWEEKVKTKNENNN